MHITGTANVFEARFTVEVTDGEGLIVATTPVMATSGTGTRGTFDVTVSYSAQRTGMGSVVVSSSSPRDGARINVVETPVFIDG